MMNQKAYDKLPKKLQDALLKAQAGAGDYSAELMGKAAEESIARMEKKGVTFRVIDRKPFIESMAAFYKDMEDKGELPEGFLAAVEATRTH